MRYTRMPIEVESPEERGYGNIQCNLAESSVRDILLSDVGVDLKNLVLFYGEHKGLGKLREVIVEDSSVLQPEHVLVTTGAATALFMVSTTLLNPEDHLIVIRPNYGTNIETPRAIHCQVTIIDLKFEEGFALNADLIRAAMQPNTKLISITSPQNPTGILIPEPTIDALAQLAEEKNCFLLVDETYRDLNFQTGLNPYAAERSAHVLSVSSVSKSFGAPGIRIGWVICRNQKLMHDLLAAKEQINICNSVVDEEIAYQLLADKTDRLKHHHALIQTNFAYLKEWMNQQNLLEWVEPQAGVVCFPRLRKEHVLSAVNWSETLFEKYSTIVGPGHWFEQEKTYMRIGFGYPHLPELKQGLANVEACLKSLLPS